MAKLDCSAVNCVYNKEKNCCKGDIMVGGKHAENKDDTCCESFAAKRVTNAYISALEHPCRTISIDCEATQCQYNKNSIFHSNPNDFREKFVFQYKKVAVISQLFPL